MEGGRQSTGTERQESGDPILDVVPKLATGVHNGTSAQKPDKGGDSCVILRKA